MRAVVAGPGSSALMRSPYDPSSLLRTRCNLRFKLRHVTPAKGVPVTAAAASPSAAQRTHRTVRVGARDIHLTEAGPADGTPVVMLHGGGPGATGSGAR
ncbi:hypothetical protein DUHN55_16240 [Helicobacter pylori]